MPERLNFTKLTLARIPPPPSGRKYIHDTKVPPLYMIVTRTGARSFYLYKKVRGVPERIFLGKFPGMTVEQARRQATVSIGDRVSDQLSTESFQVWFLRMSFSQALEQYLQLDDTN